MIPRFCDEDRVGRGVKSAWDDHFPGAQRCPAGASTDLGAEVNRSRCGSEPISVRNSTDLGEEEAAARGRHGDGTASARGRHGVSTGTAQRRSQ